MAANSEVISPAWYCLLRWQIISFGGAFEQGGEETKTLVYVNVWENVSSTPAISGSDTQDHSPEIMKRFDCVRSIRVLDRGISGKRHHSSNGNDE